MLKKRVNLRLLCAIIELSLKRHVKIKVKKIYIQGDDYFMKKRISIVLTTMGIITFCVLTYYTSSTEANKESDSIVTDKNGEVVEPLNEDNGNLGH